MSHIRKIMLAALSVVALTACDGRGGVAENSESSANSETELSGSAEADASLPSTQACSASAAGLNQMIDLSRGQMKYNGNGELVMEEAAWNQFPTMYKVGLARVVALVAACPDGSPEDAIVTIRGKEGNAVLAKGKYTEFEDL